MKVRQSFEQAVCILLLIGVSDTALKNKDISEKLRVSDSYLKKIMRQLVIADFITSKASKLGGFSLKKSLSNISLLDVFQAIEGKEPFVEVTHLVDRVFSIGEAGRKVEDQLDGYFQKAEAQYQEALKKIMLQDLIDAVHREDIHEK